MKHFYVAIHSNSAQSYLTSNLSKFHERVLKALDNLGPIQEIRSFNTQLEAISFMQLQEDIQDHPPLPEDIEITI